MSLSIVEHPVLSDLKRAIVYKRPGQLSVYYHNDGQFYPLGGIRCPKAFTSSGDAAQIAVRLEVPNV